MEINVKKGTNSQYTAEVKIPSEDVKKHLEEAVAHEAENVEIKGFRKGAAPLHLVKEKIDPAKLRSHALNHILPGVYSTIIKEHKIQPIIDPRFEIVQFEDDQELIVNVILIERPVITLNDYKKALKEKYKENKKKLESSKVSEIVNADKKDDTKPVDDKTPKTADLTNDEIVEVLIHTTEIGLADLLIEEEANRMLSDMIDQLGKMGINIEQYLQSINKKPEDVRKEYLEIAKKTLHADFAVTQIAMDEGYKVEEEEIDKTISSVPDEKSREVLAKPEQRAYIRAILTKSKTLTKLAEIAKDDSK